jgi:hypothetical protein
MCVIYVYIHQDPAQCSAWLEANHPNFRAEMLADAMDELDVDDGDEKVDAHPYFFLFLFLFFTSLYL